MHTKCYIKMFLPVAVLAISLNHSAFAQSGDRKGHENQTAPVPAELIPESPHIDGEEMLKTFEVANGFEVDLIAGEAMLDMPIAMKYDANGRAWIVEMRGYMEDVDGSTQHIPKGRITILEDVDDDGKMDTRKVFLDKILLPRAICFVENGLLYADNSTLYFVKIEDDKPINITVVDPKYSAGGNVEHKPNGLLRALDNWIYSAKSSKRYRKINGEWVSQDTEFRGQWGIAMDDEGHLYHNANSTFLVGDYVPPNFFKSNPKNQFNTLKSSQRIGGNRVYPIRVTPGVNRAYISKANGYDQNILDPKTGKLKNVTSASGLAVYRDELMFPDSEKNAIICAPCANVVKLMLLDEDHSKEGLEAKQKLGKKEIIASTSERFRPVSACNAPDGTITIVDLGRGIIQDKKYMTSYLRNQVLSRGLDKPGLGTGSLYRLKSSNQKRRKKPELGSAEVDELVETLKHPNGWWRDTAQQLLVDRKEKKSIPLLKNLAVTKDEPLAQIHALWVLEGLAAIDADTITAVFNSTKNTSVLKQALLLTSSIQDLKKYTDLKNAIVKLQGDYGLELYLARAMGQFADPKMDERLIELLKKYSANKYIRAAVFAGLSNREENFLEICAKNNYNDVQFLDLLTKSDKPPHLAVGKDLTKKQQLSYDKGKELYSVNCMACHLEQGIGIDNLGPPLVDSDWVTGDEERLVRVLLHGLQGPITVSGKKFSPLAVMPGLVHNPTIKDKDLADISNYIRNAWGNKAAPITESFVKKQREVTKDRNGSPYKESDFKISK